VSSPAGAVERWLAWRYLATRQREGFVSFIAIFSLIGVALGVATLIVVLSVMGGFREQLLGRIIGLNGHIVITARDGGMAQATPELLAKLKAFPGVRAVIDPISWVVHLFKPAPANTAPTASAVWTPASQGDLTAGGTLTVRLQPAKGTPNAGLKYTLSVQGEPNAKSGVLSATQETVETFSLPNAPTSVSLTVGDDPVHTNVPVTLPTARANP
jgi:hypothetical protein